MEQKSSCQDGQHPVGPLKVQDGVKGKAAQVGGVLLVLSGAGHRAGVILKFLPNIMRQMSAQIGHIGLTGFGIRDDARFEADGWGFRSSVYLSV